MKTPSRGNWWVPSLFPIAVAVAVIWTAGIVVIVAHFVVLLARGPA